MNVSIELNKKAIGILTLVLASLISLSPFAIDTYVPAIPVMAQWFNTPLSDIQLSMTIYILGYAIGQFLGGPLSDNFGRKLIVYIGLFVFCVTSFALSKCNSLGQLYVLRFIQALGGGFSVVVAMAIVRDLFTGRDLARRISYISMFMMAAPLLAPAVGTFLLKMFGWRSIFSFLTIYSLLVIVLITFFIPETNKNGNRESIIRTTLSSYVSVFSNGKAMGFILATALGFSGMFTFITGSSEIYIEHFQIPVEMFPLLFGSNVLLMMTMSGVNARMVKYIEPKRILTVGLVIQLLAGALLCLTMLKGNIPFVPVYLLIVVFVGVLGVISGNANASVLHMFPNSSGATTAVIGVTQYAMAGITGMLLHTLQDDTILPFGIMMFACAFAANLVYRFLN
ncbi:MAG: Bcr/CflA family multidrug efflux MFS transporter [Marinifilaceae bacterium]